MVRLWPALFTLVLFSAGCQTRAKLPDLPKVSPSSFPAAVRAQIQEAYDRAAAHPMDSEANGRLAMVLHSYSENDTAEQGYRRACALDPGRFEWAYYLGVLQLARGNTAGAVKSFAAAVRIRPEDLPARMKLAGALLAARSPARSRKIYEEVLAEDPDLALAHFGLANVLKAEGDRKGQIRHLEIATGLAPRFGPAHFELASAYRSAGNAAGAEAELDLYRRDPSGGPTDHYLARVMALNQSSLYRVQIADKLITSGRPEEAASLLEEVAAIDPSDESARVNLVVAYWQLGQWERAAEHYRAAVRLNPATRAHTPYGLVEFEQKHFGEAERAFARALEISPRDAAAHTQMGRVLEATGRKREALAHYRQALAADPRSRAANYVLGLALVESGEVDEAILHLEKTLDPADEKTPGYLRALAQAYSRAGRTQQAAATYERARLLALSGSQGQLAAEIASEVERQPR